MPYTHPGFQRASEVSLLELCWGRPSFRAPHSPGIMDVTLFLVMGLLGTFDSHPGPLGLGLLITGMSMVCL